LNSNS